MGKVTHLLDQVSVAATNSIDVFPDAVKDKTCHFQIVAHNFQTVDTFEVRIQAKTGRQSSVYIQLKRTDQSNSATTGAPNISFNGINWKDPGGSIRDISLVTKEIPLTPQMRVRLQSISDAAGGDLAISVWMVE